MGTLEQNQASALRQVHTCLSTIASTGLIGTWGPLTGTAKSELASHHLRDAPSPARWDVLGGDLGYPTGLPTLELQESGNACREAGDSLWAVCWPEGLPSAKCLMRDSIQ